MQYDISVVSYWNTIPLLYGLNNYQTFRQQHRLYTDYPAVCGQKTMQGTVDVGLIPVALLALMPEKYIVADYCIGTNKYVDSVLLVSDVPVNEIETILLDYQSNTSVKLTQVLAQHYWKITPAWKNTIAGYEHSIGGSTAAVIIGNRTFEPHVRQHAYIYDLAECWQAFTGLPFVFACWVTAKTTVANDTAFVQLLNEALAYGLQNTATAINEAMRSNNVNISHAQLTHYLTQNIDYQLNTSKKEALNLFLKYLRE